MVDIKYKHRYECPRCGKVYVKLNYAVKHYRRHLKEEINNKTKKV